MYLYFSRLIAITTSHLEFQILLEISWTLHFLPCSLCFSLSETVRLSLTFFGLSFHTFWQGAQGLIILLLLRLFYRPQSKQTLAFLAFSQVICLRISSLKLLLHEAESIIIWSAHIFNVWMNVPSGTGCMNHSAYACFLILWIVVCVK